MLQSDSIMTLLYSTAETVLNTICRRNREPNMPTPNTIVPVAHIRVADYDYNVYISMDTANRKINIFKYNEVSCDYDSFDNQRDACAFLEKPLQKPKRY